MFLDVERSRIQRPDEPKRVESRRGKDSLQRLTKRQGNQLND